LIVVSDTSPVLNLARIGRLDLLPALYGQVLIPLAVYRELVESKRDLPPAVDFASVGWLVVASANDKARVLALRDELDAGEAEAIVLAIERRADLLLVDERRGRRTARAAGLAVTGLLGVVAAAKRAGLIELAKPIVDELIQTARFWIGPELYAEVLAELGEAEPIP
jgi:predicted nucleic acid-binding protein